MSIQVKKKHAPKGVRLGWVPMKDVKSVRLTPDLLEGEKIIETSQVSKTSLVSESSYLIP